MKKYILMAAAAIAAMPAIAQETYESAKFANEDLNGTARYVGMGGAMDALGADISVIRSNPAGIGLFRHNTASMSFGVVSQNGGTNFANGSQTNMSFDQIGFVYSIRSNRKNFVNFAFNYHKSKNFDYILSAANTLNGSSQHRQSYIKGAQGDVSAGGFSPQKDNDGTYIGYEYAHSTYVANTFNQADYLYWNALIPDESGNFGYNDADRFTFNRAHTGWIGEYDFNFSGNSNDRVYLGLTVGVKTVHYKGYSEYTEHLLSYDNATDAGTIAMTDTRKINGAGVDLSGGIIFRPVEESPFRIGLSISTPTWYDLTTKNETHFINGTRSVGLYNEGHSSEKYDFKLYTPWRFGLSLGHTIDNYIALGASYEFADYGSIDNRFDDGVYYDYYSGSYESSTSDRAMNDHTEKTLKGVSTFKVGAEIKVDPSLALRVGYNYVSPMYQKNGFKDTGVNSSASYYTSATDYTNWRGTERITFGLGYKVKKFYVDLAYQYSQTDGDFYPFTNGTSVTMNGETLTNSVAATAVSNKRHQLLCTLGCKF